MCVPSNNRGFSLVEVTLSVGLLAFAMVALMALLPNGLTSSLDASRQTAAASVATRIVADLRATAAGPPPQVSAVYGVNLTNGFSRFFTDALGQPQTGRETADFLVEVSCGATPTNGNARTGVLRMRWPAADEDPSGSLSFFFAY